MRRLLLPLACPIVAALSLLVPSAPTTDPWGWILWGHQTAHLDLDTDLNGSPSWKPLPVFFTTLFSLGGDAAPGLWLWFARTAGLLSLLVAYRVGSRLAGRAGGPGPLAGVISAQTLLLSSDWVRTWLHGYTEPLMAGLLLGALDRHLSNRRGQAFLLLGAAALTRPEIFGPLALYGLWAFEGGERWRWLAGSLLVPLLWIVPDWIGSGDPFNANNIAAQTPGYQGITAGGALGQGALLMGVPALVLAPLGAALALRRGERTVPWIALLTVLFYLVIFLAMLLGYPHGPRFYEPPATFLTVLAGTGAALAVAEVQWRRAAAVAVAVGALVWVALLVPDTVSTVRGARGRAELQDQLREAARRLPPGSLRGAYPALPRGLNWNKIALDWELGVRPRDVLALTTTAPHFIAVLGRGESVPDPERQISIFASGKRGALVVFVPFGNAPVRVRSHVHWRMRTLAVSHRWRALRLDPSI